MGEKVRCPHCQQFMEHQRGYLPTHTTDIQRGVFVTGSKVCDGSNVKIVTECREVEYKHECDTCGVVTEIKITEDYPGAFVDGVKPFLEVNCFGCSTEHDGYYCSNDGCGLEVEDLPPRWRVYDSMGRHLTLPDDPMVMDLPSEADAEQLVEVLVNAGSDEQDLSIDHLPAGWYEVREPRRAGMATYNCRAGIAKGSAGPTGEHRGVFKPKYEHKVIVTDGHLIHEEPEPGEAVEVAAKPSNVVLICDCCGLRREELPYHHDTHDDSGRSWDYCQECENAGCDLIDCSVRANQRAGRAHA